MNTDSISSAYASSLAQAQNVEKLKDSAKSAKSDQEMLDACKEFETYLWEQVIKSMKDTTKVFSDEKGSGSQQVDYFMDSAITRAASAMTDQDLGPNSLAMQMYEQMKRNNNAVTIEDILGQQGAPDSSSEGE